MRRLLPGLAVLALACSQSNPPAAVTPVTAHPPATAAPTPLLSCRLPVAGPPGSKDNRGQWLDLATGSLTIDPASLTADRLFYSRSAKKWLPVNREGVSPDGLRYAYTDAFQPGVNNRLHVVDAQTGKESIFPLPGNGPGASTYAVADFGAAGVSLITASEGTAGLFRVDPSTGAFRTIAQVAPVWLVDGDTVWTGSVNPADAHPLAGMTTQPDQVDRVTVGGARETWLYREATSLSVVGVDGRGSPLVLAFQQMNESDAQLLLLTAPNVTRMIASDSQASLRPTAIDSHGTWFSGRDGIYLLPDGGSLEKVSNIVAVPAGGCE